MRREVVWFFSFLWSITAFAVDTEVSLYQPMMNAKTQSPAIVAKRVGQCAQQSELIKREDAWRCISENKVFDPCFIQPDGSHLHAVCPTSPWVNQAVEITVSSPLDNKQYQALDMSRTFPWAIELTTGEKCQAIDTREEYDGLPVRYRCDKQTELIGHVQRCEGMWKMLQHASNGVDSVQIARAWF